MVSPPTMAYDCLIGVDGGGTGTRIRIERPDCAAIGCGASGPSTLARGVEQSWTAILEAVANAFAAIGADRPPLSRMAIGLGLAGVHNRQWAASFHAKNPGFGMVALETDGFTTLLGAHRGQPGAIVAIGTGSIGEIWTAQGQRREVGGWGFPASDEGGGAWIGLRAMNHAQRMLDGRVPTGAFGQAVVDFCGGGRDSVFDWLASATQTDFARLAPLALEHAAHDEAAAAILRQAGDEIARIADALDPEGSLPLALCGGLAAPLRSYLPPALLARTSEACADAAAGALHLLRAKLLEQSRNA